MTRNYKLVVHPESEVILMEKLDITTGAVLVMEAGRPGSPCTRRVGVDPY